MSQALASYSFRISQTKVANKQYTNYLATSHGYKMVNYTTANQPQDMSVHSTFLKQTTVKILNQVKCFYL